MIIAQRGVQLLKSGGLMVYSTCSMSPYEDEAVIAELLRHFKGQLELVDAREFVPVFKARPGLTNWHVIDDALSVKKMASEKKFIAKRARFDKRMESDKKSAEGASAAVEGEGEVEGEEAGKEEEAEAAAMEVSEEEAKKDAATEEGAEKVVHGDDGRETYHQAIPEDPLVGASLLLLYLFTLFLPLLFYILIIEPLFTLLSFFSCIILSILLILISHTDTFICPPPITAECVKMGMTYYPTYESVPSHLTRKIRKSYFPPTEEENSWMHLGN
jgi:16S rRNA methyltransferase RsmB/F